MNIRPREPHSFIALLVILLFLPHTSVVWADSYWDSCGDDMVINLTSPGIYHSESPNAAYASRGGCYFWNVRVTGSQGRTMTFTPSWVSYPSNPQQCEATSVFYNVTIPAGDGSYDIIGSGEMHGKWFNLFGSEVCVPDVVVGTYNVRIDNAPSNAYRIKVLVTESGIAQLAKAYINADFIIP